MAKIQLAPFALVLLAFLSAFCFYPSMPDKVASHWNLDGNVDGYMDKAAGVFFVPVLALFIAILFLALPHLDPLKKNYRFFRKEYDCMVFAFLGFTLYVYLLTIAYNLWLEFNLMQLLSPGFAALFYYLGVVVEKAKQNWFVGITTPWTLSSERVWDKTHQICGKMFKAAGIIALFGIFMREFFIASIALLIAIGIFGMVYSYVEYGKEKRKRR